MRFLLFVTHTLPLITLYADSLLLGEFGYREPNVFKNYIYTTTLNEDFFNNSAPHIGYTFPSENNYNILLHRGERFHFEFSEREGYFIESLEFFLLDDEVYHLSSFNIFSHDLYSETSSIHHSLFFKRTGIFSYGLLTVFNFSPHYPMGNKTILYSNLDLHNFQYKQLLEIRENYFAPEGDKQKNSIRNKNIMTFNSSGTLIPELYQSITYEETLWDLIHRLNLKKLISDIEINLQFQHRQKKLTELLCKFRLKLPINFITLTIEPTIRYINTPIYNHTSSLYIELPKDWSMTLKHKWEFIEDYNNITSCKISREGKRYRFHLAYTQEWTGRETEWNINGSISLKGY